ncbi:hypothetical protein DXB96_03505 [Clostridium sp. OM07-10AC]|nr:hypothetical protein DXC08_04760 [Clostridium sp. OM07-9AC]RHV07439.1 hypothetical protein DXB96_03505 [Clostridium sp. OM07-10AC]
MKIKQCIKKIAFLCLVAGLLISGILGMGVSAQKKKTVISSKKLILSVGQKKKLKVKKKNKTVKWSSGNKKVATVNSKGIVCGKKTGKTTVTAIVQMKKYVWKVTVKDVKKPAEAVTQKPVIPEPSPAVPTATATAAPIPSQTVTLSPEQEWEIGKTSGTKEAFQQYFHPDMKQYTGKKQGVPLGNFEEMTYPSEIVGAEREAYVYLPPEYDSSKKYPVLYLLHGIGCDRGQWRYMYLNEILSNMIYTGELQPVVAVIPSIVPKDGLNKDTFSAENIEAFTKFEKEFIQDLEPYVLANYGVSSKREDTGVCGLSMGGMEALRLGFAIKDHFNYIGSFSAAPTLDTGILTLDGWKTKPQTVLLCTGDADGTVGSNPQDYHEKLVENNVDHIWYLYPKGKHDEKVWKNGLVNFLKRSYK